MTWNPWLRLVIDVPREHWQTSLDFWSAATGWTVLSPRGEGGQGTTLAPVTGLGWVRIQAIDGGGRLHLDLDSADGAAAQDRSTSLGARLVCTHEGASVMRSPGRLCFRHTSEPRGRIDRSDPLRVLDQVCIDIPANLWDAETAFWRDLTGRELTKGGQPEFSFLGEDGALRVLLQRLDETGGDVRAHPDFAVGDRATDTRRHEAIGAEVLAVMPWWTVLRAPDGHVYCLTEREPESGSVRAR